MSIAIAMSWEGLWVRVGFWADEAGEEEVKLEGVCREAFRRGWAVRVWLTAFRMKGRGVSFSVLGRRGLRVLRRVLRGCMFTGVVYRK